MPGNKAADEAAREGTQRTGEAVCLAAAAKRQIYRRIKDRWAREWKTEKTGRTTYKLVEIPNRRVLDLYRGLPKPYASIIIQIRTQKSGLKYFLFKIKVSDSDQCYCGLGSQIPRHILLQYPLYAESRKVILDKLDPRVRGKMDYNRIISHPQAMCYVAEFVHQIELFSQFRDVERTGYYKRGTDVEDDM